MHFPAGQVADPMTADRRPLRHSESGARVQRSRFQALPKEKLAALGERPAGCRQDRDVAAGSGQPALAFTRRFRNFS